MTTTCACQPGTYDTYWFEVRCEPCIQVERDAWARACAFRPMRRHA